MKATKLLAVLISLALLGKAEATITRGQTFSGSTGGTDATSLALTVVAPDLTDGKYHYMVIAVGSAATGWMTADAGYTFNVFNHAGASSAAIAGLYVGRVFSGAGTTITINYVAAQPIAAVGAEYICDAPIRLDRGAVAAATNTSPSVGATQTTSTAAEVCFAAICHRLASASTTGTFSAPTNSYAEISAGGKATNHNTSNNDRECDLLEKFLTSTGTTTAGATVTGSNNWDAVVATFEEVSVSSAKAIPSIGH